MTKGVVYDSKMEYEVKNTVRGVINKLETEVGNLDTNYHFKIGEMIEYYRALDALQNLLSAIPPKLEELKQRGEK